MRSMKFRFYDPFNECYTYSDKVGSLSKFFELYEACVQGENKPILEQFTGLKDKNGVDVYEGNVLYWKHVSVLSLPHVVTERKLNVVWDDKESRWSQYEHGDCEGAFNIWRDWKECEVIGNIHQHPELLGKEEQDGL